MCKNEQSSSYFDDCPICRYVKNQEEKGQPLMEDDLRAAFKEASDQQACQSKAE